jgi:hypothetical protein
MKEFILAIIIATVLTCIFVNPPSEPARVPVSIYDVKPAEQGVRKSQEFAIPEMKVNVNPRIFRYGSSVSDKHDNQRVDMPRFGAF